MTYRIKYEQVPWECECCGYGSHEIISLYDDGEEITRWSHDDRFGGQIGHNDLPLPHGGYSDGEAFACGLLAGLIHLGVEAYIEKHKVGEE